MSRFTVTILLACVLLGILLWIVLSTVAEFANPQPAIIAAEEPDAPQFDPALPVIETTAELRDWLQEQQLDGGSLIADLQEWKTARGFPVRTSWPTAENGDAAGENPLESVDDTTLIVLTRNGDIDAAALLAERSMRSNPVEALDWWNQAVVQGSLYAMLRMSDLLQTLGNPELGSFRSDSVWRQALDEINSQSPSARERALAWALAAVTLGGYVVIDDVQAERITMLTGALDSAQTQRACEIAQEYVLDTATARRAQGGAVFFTERPLFAVSVADPRLLLPCGVPIIPLVDFGGCISEYFVGPGNRLWQAWFCPSP